jgi:hypothetical protein
MSGTRQMTPMSSSGRTLITQSAIQTVSGYPGLFSVRVGLRYRALAYRADDDLYWFWIGTHADYDHLIAQF